MIKFEIPYNLDPAYPEKLLQRPALIPYIDCIYAAAWKDDCDNTRFDITFRSDYPKTYEEYVERIKSLLALGIPVCILAQKKTTITMIRKYRALGIHQFILNDDKLAARIKQEYPEVRLTLSIMRALTLSELQTGDYSMYDRIVLFHWFARHLEALQQLPTGYQYTMIANSACYHDCKWHDEHWFLKGDTPENYAKESERVCSSCTALLSKGKQQSAYIEPEDLRYFDPYHKYIAWCCNTHIKDKDRCHMLFVKDVALKQAFTTMLNKLIFSHRQILKPYLESLKTSSSDDSLHRIQQIQTLLAQNTEKRETLTMLMTQGIIDPVLYSQETNELLSQADSFRDEIEALKNEVSGDVNKVTETTALIHFAEKSAMLQEFDKDLFDRYVKRIIVHSRNDIRFELKCGLTLRERK